MQPLNNIWAPAIFPLQQKETKTSLDSSTTQVALSILTNLTEAKIPNAARGLSRSPTHSSLQSLIEVEGSSPPSSFEEFCKMVNPPPKTTAKSENFFPPPLSPKTSPASNTYSPGIALNSRKHYKPSILKSSMEDFS